MPFARCGCTPHSFSEAGGDWWSEPFGASSSSYWRARAVIKWGRVVGRKQQPSGHSRTVSEGCTSSVTATPLMLFTVIFMVASQLAALPLVTAPVVGRAARSSASWEDSEANSATCLWPVWCIDKGFLQAAAPGKYKPLVKARLTARLPCNVPGEPHTKPHCTCAARRQRGKAGTLRRKEYLFRLLFTDFSVCFWGRKKK